MAISLNYVSLKQKGYNPKYFNNLEEFIDYHILDLREKGNYIYYTGPDGVEKKLPAINHYPELKEYEVWIEGYVATGERAEASLIGKAKARNFAQACHIVMCKWKLENIQEENSLKEGEWCDPARWDYDPHTLRFWNCSLYWSEDMARKTFG